MKKIAFLGNGCTGKTTSMMNLVSKMKLWELKVGYVADLSRSITFAPDKFDTNDQARLHVLYKQIAAECEQGVRNDVDYVLTERTAMDWLIYYAWTCNNISLDPNPVHAELVNQWAQTYDLIFYMDDEKIDYVADGFRPASTKLRDEISTYYADVYITLRDMDLPIVKVASDSIADRVVSIEQYVEKWVKNG